MDLDGRGRRAWALDWVLAVAFTVAVLGITHRVQGGQDSDYRHLDTGGYTLVVVAGLALAWRRRTPLTVLAVTTAAMALYAGFSYPGGPVYLAPIVAMFTVATLYPRRVWIATVIPAAAVISIVGAVAANSSGVSWFHLVYFTWGIAAGFVGEAARARRQHVLDVEERARRLEASREEEGRRLVAEERLRIARDLHDSVAHSLASINVQASAGAHVGGLHPEQAHAALLAIKAASKDALEELRATLGALRARDEDAPRAPGPSVARIDALVERTRQAGLPVTVSVAGAPVALPAPVDAAAYRIVQESLTNTLRHAGHAQATVTLTYGGDTIDVDVADDGIGPSTLNHAPGHGIAGMRERAAALGGTLSAGAQPGGGYRVHAVLPVRAEVAT